MAAKLTVQKPWSSGEADRLRRMLAKGHSAGAVARVLGRTRQSVLGYLQRHPELRPTDLANNWSTENGRKRERGPDKAPRMSKSAPAPELPPVRYASLTASLFGDPPIGRSALDRKRAQETAVTEARGIWGKLTSDNKELRKRSLARWGA